MFVALWHFAESLLLEEKHVVSLSTLWQTLGAEIAQFVTLGCKDAEGSCLRCGSPLDWRDLV